MSEEVGNQEIKKAKRGKQQICVNCGRQVIHHERSTLICMDCLVLRIGQILPPTKRRKFLEGIIQEQTKKE